GITDTVTGTLRTYANPFGSLASVADTAAFDGGSSVVGESTVGSRQSTVEDAGGSAGSGQDARPATLDVRPLSAPCAAGDSTLCLNVVRFKVEVGWEVVAQGTKGSARAVPLTGDTGEFWFFSANTI